MKELNKYYKYIENPWITTIDSYKFYQNCSIYGSRTGFKPLGGAKYRVYRKDAWKYFKFLHLRTYYSVYLYWSWRCLLKLMTPYSCSGHRVGLNWPSTSKCIPSIQNKSIWEQANWVHGLGASTEIEMNDIFEIVFTPDQIADILGAKFVWALDVSNEEILDPWVRWYVLTQGRDYM